VMGLRALSVVTTAREIKLNIMAPPAVLSLVIFVEVQFHLFLMSHMR